MNSTNVEFYPDAGALRWERFVPEIMGDDPALVEFVHLASGYSLTVRVFCAVGDLRDFAVSTASLPHQSIGGPLAAKFTSDSLSPINTLHDGGEFHIGIIPCSIANDPEEWPWTA